MYEVDAKCASWSHTLAGRGKRKAMVRVGCYVVEHMSTGKFIVACSKNVAEEVDITIQKLLEGTTKNRAFNRLCQTCPDLTLYEYDTKTLTEARKIEAVIRKTVMPKYLLLN